MQDTHEYLVNTKFPEFNLYDEKRKFITEENLNGKWSVIFFYPKDDSPGCTLQSCSFRDKYEEFNDLGVQIFGVSSDSVSSHRKFKEKHNLQYSLLSDKGGILAKNLKLKKNLGLIAARVTLIINPERLIIYAHTSQLGVMGHVRKALNEIKVREINI
jgi:peroxiredoxin Q/BCP